MTAMIILTIVMWALLNLLIKLLRTCLHENNTKKNCHLFTLQFFRAATCKKLWNNKNR